MRVTNLMMINSLKRNLNTNMRSLEKNQNQLSTGHRISKPSDDPVGITNTLRYSTTIIESEEYLNKIGEAKNFMNTTDSALNNLGDILQRANELVINGTNGSNSQASREAIAAEIRQLSEQIVVIANTVYGSKHVFAGTNVTEPPFYQEGGQWQWRGNNREINLEIGAGVTIPVNSLMGDLFFNQDAAAPGVFQLLGNIATHLENGDQAALQQDLTLVQTRLDEVNRERAIVGAKVNRLELQENRLESSRINYTELLSNNQDADMAEVIMELKMQENVYRSSLAAGARIIMPNLVEFLR